MSQSLSHPELGLRRAAPAGKLTATIITLPECCRRSAGTSMKKPDDKTIVAAKTGSSRRQAIGVMGTTVAAGLASTPALGAATPLHMPVPPPALVPRGDLV